MVICFVAADATQIFEENKHSVEAREMMQAFFVGIFVEVGLCYIHLCSLVFVASFLYQVPATLIRSENIGGKAKGKDEFLRFVILIYSLSLSLSRLVCGRVVSIAH